MEILGGTQTVLCGPFIFAKRPIIVTINTVRVICDKLMETRMRYGIII